MSYAVATEETEREREIFYFAPDAAADKFFHLIRVRVQSVICRMACASSTQCMKAMREEFELV